MVDAAAAVVVVARIEREEAVEAVASYPPLDLLFL